MARKTQATQVKQTQATKSKQDESNEPKFVPLTTSRGSKYQVPEQFVHDNMTISSVIRKMSAAGLSKGDIARQTGARYQHVRNVLVEPVSTGAANDNNKGTNKGTNKSK